jgi:DoxX-like family
VDRARIISFVPALLILFGAIVKLMKTPAVVQGFAPHGYPEHLVVVVGIIELTCTIIYLIPQTSVLDAILMTALMGGATDANLWVGNPTCVVTVVLGVLVWGGLFFRDPRLRALIPLRK